MTIAENRADLWPLDPGVAFLNHGSFGACPTEVLRHQAALRAEMEAEPVRFLSRELDDRLDAARRALAAFVGADPDDLDFVAGRADARVVVARVPFPVASPAEVVDAVMARVTPGTRLALLDHVTSPT